MRLRPSRVALFIITALSLLTTPALGERIVFRDGKSTMVAKSPCISGDKVQIEIEGLPTPIAYDRDLVDEAKTFHANPQTPVQVLFAPCSATGPVATGVAGTTPPPAASVSAAPSAPMKAYSPPSTSSGSSYQSSSAQCAAITKKGTRCSRRAQPGRAYCYQH